MVLAKSNGNEIVLDRFGRSKPKSNFLRWLFLPSQSSSNGLSSSQSDVSLTHKELIGFNLQKGNVDENNDNDSDVMQKDFGGFLFLSINCDYICHQTDSLGTINTK